MATTGVNRVNDASKELMALLAQLKALLSAQPPTLPENKSMAITGRVIEHTQPGNPFLPTTIIKEGGNQYAQPISILGGKTNMSINSSRKEIDLIRNMVAKISYILQEEPKLGSGKGSLNTEECLTSADRHYQAIGHLKNTFDEEKKLTASQEILNKLNSLSTEIQEHKTEIINIKNKLSDIVDNFFKGEMIDCQVTENFFKNQQYVSEKKFNTQLDKAKSKMNDYEKSIIVVNNEIQTEKINIEKLWKEKNFSELTDKIKTVAFLKLVKIKKIKKEMEDNLYPLWSKAVEKHTELLKNIENNINNQSNDKSVNELKKIKEDNVQEFLMLSNLQEEYQQKMPKKKLLSNEIGPEAKKLKNRLTEIMDAIHEFSEKTEGLLKK